MNQIENQEIEFYKNLAEKYRNETYRLHTWAVFVTVGLLGTLICLFIVIAKG
jgi:hypothetical protein